MFTSQLIFRTLGTIHGVAGVALLVAALNKEFQEFCFYRYRDAFQGGLHKSLALLGSALLIACGVLTFFKPVFAVGAAWLSLVIYLLPSLTRLMAGQPFGRFCRECAVSFGVRGVAFAAFTIALLHD
jgi:hypothetical protein